MSIAPLSLVLGPYQVYAVPTGQFALDGGAMFGIIPKALWEQATPPDAQNRIRLEARALLLVSGHHKILIDTGNGGDFVAKYGRGQGRMMQAHLGLAQDGLLAGLAALGVSADEITDVILTHLHFDHAGGATCFDSAQGKVVPRFPRARYYVQQENWQTATHPNPRERGSYLEANFLPLQSHDCLHLLEGPCKDLLPNIDILVSHGHTRGQQLVKIRGDDKVLVYCGDLLPTSHHVRLAWLMAYDINPLVLMEEKQVLLSQAAEEGWYLFLEHDDAFDAVQVVAADGDFRVDARYRLF